MCIPPFFESAEKCAHISANCVAFADDLATRLARPLPALSMGMSHDFAVAIAEGATEVRIGTALFGTRRKSEIKSLEDGRKVNFANQRGIPHVAFHAVQAARNRIQNRIVVSPMCEYSAKDGHPQPWHMVHLGSRAIGGAALVFTEATAVQDIGRISAQDAGIYEDAHIASWRPIAEFIRANGAIAGMQLAHAGRKGSTAVPWAGGRK